MHAAVDFYLMINFLKKSSSIETSCLGRLAREERGNYLR